MKGALLGIFFFKKIKNLIVFVSIIAIFTMIVLFSSCQFRVIDRFEESREMMGTYVNITVYGPQEEAEKSIDAAFESIALIEKIASIYDEESEVSFLNREGYIENPSPDLVELIRLSKEYSEITGGSFDITIQPVLKLWSEGLWQESEEVQEKTVGEALRLVGSDMIEVDENKISFKQKDMAVTLGGIAKGYAVDRALEVIGEHGIKYALVDAGGDIGTIGSKPDGSKWSVKLRDPDDPDNQESGMESLPTFIFEGRAVATSGNYYRYYDPEKEVHHISDPKTGYSASSCISVTIIADTCTEADVLATAVFVMGPEDGMELVESLGNVESLIIDSERNVYKSSGLLGYIE
ncbi:MAG: FAD:protein FMN transferase [Actinobacteria bacterium]|nr:FAD:protein FMN transferase [Actinomycetota bacterium]